jgi:hypothetical protein
MHASHDYVHVNIHKHNTNTNTARNWNTAVGEERVVVLAYGAADGPQTQHGIITYVIQENL